jgi:hypothetical protein
MAELFENVEVNREPRWQVLLRLVTASLILHVILVYTAITVPVFRDTLNIAALIARTKFVERDYNATQIVDDVQLVQLAGEKFRYPDGYFAPEGLVPGEAVVLNPVNDPFAPKIISQAKPGGGVDPEKSASPSPSPLASPSPGPSASPSAIAQGDDKLKQEEAQKQLEETAKKNDLDLPTENEINKKALKDFAAYANDLRTQGKLDLDKAFEIVIEAELDDKGKLQNPRFTKKEGDENLVDLFGKMIAALNDSGFLVYLQPISKDNPGATVKITVKQGESEVLASVESEASSVDRARNVAKVLNTLLVFGAGSRAGKDEEVLMKNTNATPDGKKVVVNFSMPRQTVVEMLKKQMEPGV